VTFVMPAATHHQGSGLPWASECKNVKTTAIPNPTTPSAAQKWHVTWVIHQRLRPNPRHPMPSSTHQTSVHWQVILESLPSGRCPSSNGHYWLPRMCNKIGYSNAGAAPLSKVLQRATYPRTRGACGATALSSMRIAAAPVLLVLRQ
jgi:hypothetical protein